MAGIGVTDNSGDVNGLAVNTSHELKAALNPDATGAPARVAAVKTFSENDDGAIMGEPYLQSPECDDDFRIRSASDIMLDTEAFNYANQNTGKHQGVATTMTNAWTTSGYQTNSGAVNTTGIGLTFGTYAEFPIFGSNSLYSEFEGSFSNQPVANSVIDFGLFRRGVTAAFAPLDGVYFRLGADGMIGVMNFNSVETQVEFAKPFVYVAGQKYQFIITSTEREVEFWIDNQLYGKHDVVAGNGQPFMSASLPLSIRHAHVGTAGGIIQFTLNNYTVSLGGSSFIRSLGEFGSAAYGSYQGLSGGTMGSLNPGTVTTGTLVVPTAAVPANTALTANLLAGLGGRSVETLSTGLTFGVDALLQQYQVPAGTISIPGKRLVISGIKMKANVTTILTGGGFINDFKLAFGNTTTSLQTAEATGAKKPRLIMLPELTQILTATQAAGTLVSQPGGYVCNFKNPIYVNPGEFVGLVVVRTGTAASAGVIQYDIQYDFTWE